MQNSGIFRTNFKILFFIVFTALIFSGFFIFPSVSLAATTSDIVITEFIANPAAVSDTNGEWIELRNTTASPVDLQNWTISDNSASSTITNSLIINADDYAILCIKDNVNLNGGVKCDYDWSSVTLNNDGDAIILKDDQNNIIHAITYLETDVESGKSTNVAQDNSLSTSTEAYIFGDGDFGTPANNKISINNHFYATIQLAINNANASSTINIPSATYNENITINKSITLESESSAIIDCESIGNGIVISASSVAVNRFEIINCVNGILINNSQGVDITNSLIRNNQDGIQINNGLNININNNNIYSNSLKSITENNSSSTIDAANNWWGTTSTDEISSQVSGQVDFVPYCLDENCDSSCLDSDNDNIPDKEDKVIFNPDDIATSSVSISLQEDGDIATIKDSDTNNDLIVIDTSEGSIDFSSAEIQKQTATATEASLVIKNLTLNPSQTKTVYLDIILDTDYVCVIDEQNPVASESNNCQGINLLCDGSQYGNYTCAKQAGQYKIQGLSHSAVSENTYSPPTPDPEPTASSSGGGGLPSSASNPPAPPAGGFNVIINNNKAKTNSRNVVLTLFGGTDAEKMAISNSPDFERANQEKYVSSKDWVLSEGDGSKTVYVKFFTKYGYASEIISSDISLTSGINIRDNKTQESDRAGQAETPQVMGIQTYSSNTLIRSSNKRIYLIKNGQKQYITGYLELKKYAGQPIYNASQATLGQYSTIPTPKPEIHAKNIFSNGDLIRDSSKKIYIIKSNKKQHIPNLQELQKHFHKPIYNVTNEVLGQFGS